ncbi:uncharacterized protein LOC121808955 [Salvia splendens]|uniref:uncharacterized protein LOC121808955 n=1 Tax=Salvia splendens TaxID=180675 RepID=UPI001C275D9E|nr:uncharacterized protein LOC121808955 [Salvia splendens]
MKKPLPQFTDPILPYEEPEELQEEEKRHEDEVRDEGSSSAVKRTKPYPYRGEPKRQKEAPTDFMEIFGKLEINLPFLQALKLPPFSRFIKDFIAEKAKADGKIVIGENISAVIQKKRIPSKRTDPGMFTLPIIIGDVNIEHAMCDLGASINMLPFSIYKKLTGRDFHVIRMNEAETGESSGVLLGRPFLKTAKTIIDVSEGTICLDYHGEKFMFNIDKAMKKLLEMENLHSLDKITPLVHEFLENEFLQEQLEASELDESIDE